MTGQAAAPARPPVIVLGMHRSGTSMLTGSLEAAGVLLGEVNNAAPHNRKGNKEHEGVRGLNDRIMARYGADWKSPPHDQLPLAWTQEELAEGLAQTSSLSGSGRAWGFKDPRTIWTLEGWLALVPGARLIGVFRQPGDVIGSLMARPGALALTETAALSLWIRTNRRLLALWQAHRFPLLCFSRSRLEEEFFRPLSLFTARLGLRGDVTRFYEDSLVHQDSGQEAFPSQTEELMRGLREACAISRAEQPGP